MDYACCTSSSDGGDGSRRRKWKKAPFEVGFNAGPFHYQIRASGYGELYDEIPWKVMFGAAYDKDRDACDRTSLVCRYRNGVLIHNWLEDGRDRELIRASRTPPISQYAHIYKTTYGSTIGKKRLCDKQTSMLRTILEFPRNAFPGHQPELDVDRVRCCVEKPAVCNDRECRDAWFKDLDHQKRVKKATPPPPPPE